MPKGMQSACQWPGGAPAAQCRAADDPEYGRLRYPGYGEVKRGFLSAKLKSVLFESAFRRRVEMWKHW